MAAITALSSRGQIVLPISIRKELGLTAGTQFIVFSDSNNILLKPVKEPTLEEFSKLLDKANNWAESVGMKEEDINDAIKNVRKAKKL